MNPGNVLNLGDDLREKGQDMDKETPWITVVALYAFAAFLGGLFVILFLAAVGAIDGIDIGVGGVTLGDVVAPTISAVGIVVTALIAAKGWELQRKDRRAEREMLINERRNAAKVDRMMLSHILSEISASCTIYIDELLTFSEDFPKTLAVKNRDIPELSMPETCVDKIIAVSEKQEEPLLSALAELSHIIQIKQSRSDVYRETLIRGGTRGVRVILNGKKGPDQIVDFTFKEIYESLVIHSRCMVLFEPARYFKDEPYLGKVYPNEEDFGKSMMLAGVTFNQAACEAVFRQVANKSRIDL